MDQALTGAQASTRVQPSTEVQSPTEAQRSPLGNPISQASACARAEYPLLWHSTYWLCILVLGILRGENEAVISLMITMEQDKIPDREFRRNLQNVWAEFQVCNKEEFKQTCEEWTLERPGAKPYLEDLDRLIITNMQSARVSEAKTAFVGLDELLIKPQEGLVGDQGEQDFDASESEYCSNDGWDSVG